MIDFSSSTLWTVAIRHSFGEFERWSVSFSVTIAALSNHLKETQYIVFKSQSSE